MLIHPGSKYGGVDRHAKNTCVFCRFFSASGLLKNQRLLLPKIYVFGYFYEYFGQPIEKVNQPTKRVKISL